MGFRDYLTIGEVVQKLQVHYDKLSVSKLRFLEDEGLITPERTAGGYRKYSRDDMARIELILRLQHEKFLPHAYTKKILEEYDRGLVAPELADILAQESTKDGGGVTGSGKSSVASSAGAKGGKISDSGTGSVSAGANNTYGNAADYLSDKERYALTQDEALVVSVTEMMRDERIPEIFFNELRQFGILSSLVGTGSILSARISAHDAACVRAAWALRSIGIEPRHLRMYVTFANKEADNFDLVLRPTYRHKTPRSQTMLADTAADIVQQTEILKRYLLQRELKSKLDDLL